MVLILAIAGLPLVATPLSGVGMSDTRSAACSMWIFQYPVRNFILDASSWSYTVLSYWMELHEFRGCVIL